MDAPINIRYANAADLSAILDIYNHAIIYTTAVYQYEVNTLAMREEWYADRLMHGCPVFVAEANNQVIGFSTYGPYHKSPGYRFTVENSVYVHPEHQGKGIGKQLLQTVIEHARNKGMHTIMASVDSLAIGSIKLHKSLGFVEAGHFKQIGYKFDQWLDVKYLQLMLS